MPQPQWSIIIPAFNEATRLPLTLQDIAQNMPAFGTFEMLVVDDGSSDATTEVAKQNGKLLGLNLSTIRLPKNQGKGAAVRSGIAKATGEWILITDADGAVPIANLERFVPLLGDYPIVIGSKYASVITVRRGAARTALAKSSNWLIRQTFRLPYADTQCGFKVIRRDVAQQLFAKMVIDRWTFDVELLALAQAFGHKVKEVGVAWNDDGMSRVQLLSSSLHSLREVAFIKWRLLSGRYHD